MITKYKHVKMFGAAIKCSGVLPGLSGAFNIETKIIFRISCINLWKKSGFEHLGCMKKFFAVCFHFQYCF